MGIKETIKNVFEDSIQVKNQFLSDEVNVDTLVRVAESIIDCYKHGGKIIVFGNGGSAADSQHLAAELMVRFEKDRKSFPCIALTTDTSILTAAANDQGYSEVFSRQVEALACPNDVIIGISTSGNSENVLKAVKVARDKGNKVISLSGADGGKLKEVSDISIVVKSDSTARIQEVHITVIHVLCKIIENTVMDVK